MIVTITADNGDSELGSLSVEPHFVWPRDTPIVAEIAIVSRGVTTGTYALIAIGKTGKLSLCDTTKKVTPEFEAAEAKAGEAS